MRSEPDHNVIERGTESVATQFWKIFGLFSLFALGFLVLAVAVSKWLLLPIVVAQIAAVMAISRLRCPGCGKAPTYVDLFSRKCRKCGRELGHPRDA